MPGLHDLAELTYQLEHNPNCLSPYLIRTHPGGCIDKKPRSETKDFLFYGGTLEEVVLKVLSGNRDNPDSPDE